MIPILKTSITADDLNSGIGRGYSGMYMTECTECTVSEELQGDYLLTLSYPTDAVLAEHIQVNNFIVAQVGIAEDGNGVFQPNLQVFRIRKVTADGISGMMTVEAVHIAYDMAYTIYDDYADAYGNTIPQAESTNAKIRGTGWYTITSDYDAPTPLDYDAYIGVGQPTPCNWREIMGNMEDSYLAKLNLEPEYDNKTTKLWVRRGATKNITLRYGRDITAITQSIDTTDVCKAVVAYYYKTGTGGSYTMYYQIVYFDYDSGNHYRNDRWCPCQIIDFTSDITSTTEVNIKADLRSNAKKYINNHIGLDQPQVQIDVSFERTDLANTYASILHENNILLGDSLKVIYPPLNINQTIRVVKTEYNVLLGKYNSVSLGTIQTTLATGAGKTTAKENRK